MGHGIEGGGHTLLSIVYPEKGWYWVESKCFDWRGSDVVSKVSKSGPKVVSHPRLCPLVLYRQDPITDSCAVFSAPIEKVTDSTSPLQIIRLWVGALLHHICFEYFSFQCPKFETLLQGWVVGSLTFNLEYSQITQLLGLPFVGLVWILMAFIRGHQPPRGSYGGISSCQPLDFLTE